MLKKSWKKSCKIWNKTLAKRIFSVIIILDSKKSCLGRKNLILDVCVKRNFARLKVI